MSGKRVVLIFFSMLLVAEGLTASNSDEAAWQQTQEEIAYFQQMMQMVTSPPRQTGQAYPGTVHRTITPMRPRPTRFDPCWQRRRELREELANAGVSFRCCARQNAPENLIEKMREYQKLRDRTSEERAGCCGVCLCCLGCYPCILLYDAFCPPPSVPCFDDAEECVGGCWTAFFKPLCNCLVAFEDSLYSCFGWSSNSEDLDGGA